MKIVLFSSCATGADTMESDVDLLVVTGDEAGARTSVKSVRMSWPVIAPESAQGAGK